MKEKLDMRKKKRPLLRKVARKLKSEIIIYERSDVNNKHHLFLLFA
jgi:hypothetical protein